MAFKISFCIALLALLISIVLILKKVRIPSQIKRATELVEEGEYSEASQIVKEILSQKDDFLPAKKLKANILWKQNQYLLAISEYNNILKHPNCSSQVSKIEILKSLADLYKLTKQWQKETATLHKIIEEEPQNVNILKRLGLNYFYKKEYKVAKEFLLTVEKITPEEIEIYKALGICFFNLEEYTKAEIYLQKSISNDPNSLEVMYHLGIIYKMKKDYNSAVKMFEKTKKEQKYFLSSLYSIAQMYFETEDYEKAVDTLELGLNKLKKDKQSNEYRYLLAESYAHMNRLQEAVYHWENIYNIDSDYRDVHHKLTDYKRILNDKNINRFFTASLYDLQPIISEIIARLNYNIVSKETITANEIYYKAFNVKRLTETPVLICFNRTMVTQTEEHIKNFAQTLQENGCYSGIYITTSKFTTAAKTIAKLKSIELLSGTELNKYISKINK